MKRTIITILAAVSALGLPAVMAQNSMPAPGTGSLNVPAGGGGMGPGMFGPGPGPAGTPGWGSSWGSPWGGWGYNGIYSPSTQVILSPTYQQSGKMNVVGVGYDAQGVWRNIPMTVSYNYNGAQYSVIVLTAWDPWSDSWNTQLDIPAVNTSYYLDGANYNYYAVLSTGTYYFNL